MSLSFNNSFSLNLSFNDRNDELYSPGNQASVLLFKQIVFKKIKVKLVFFLFFIL